VPSGVLTTGSSCAVVVENSNESSAARYAASEMDWSNTSNDDNDNDGGRHEDAAVTPSDLSLQNMYELYDAAACCVAPLVYEIKTAKQKRVEMLDCVRNSSHLDTLQLSRTQFSIAENDAKIDKLSHQLENAIGSFSRVRSTISRRLAHKLTDDEHICRHEVESLATAHPDDLADIATYIRSTTKLDHLRVGTVVQVLVHGERESARVTRIHRDTGQYELSLWKVVSLVGTPFEEGFDTSRAEVVSVGRMDISSTPPVTPQVFSPAALEAIRQRCQEPFVSDNLAELKELLRVVENPDLFKASKIPLPVLALSLLRQDAVEAARELMEVLQHIEREVPGVEVSVSPLKTTKFAMEEAYREHKGDYRFIVDFIAGLVHCPSITIVQNILRTIVKDPRVEVTGICNGFEKSIEGSQGRQSAASANVWVSLRLKFTGHCCQIVVAQESTASLHTGASLHVYHLSKKTGLHDPDVSMHQGFHFLFSGVMRSLPC
jgi:hypothetical protein